MPKFIEADTAEKHWVGMSACFYCLQEFEVLIDQRLQASLPRVCVYSMQPCPTCENLMKTRVILIGAAADELDHVNEQLADHKRRREHFENRPNRHSFVGRRQQFPPFVPNISRSGNLLVVPEQYIINRIIPQKLCERILKQRWCFVPEDLLMDAKQQAEKRGLTRTLQEFKEMEEHEHPTEEE